MDGKQASEHTAFSQCAKCILCLICLGFISVGVLVIVFGRGLHTSGWIDIIAIELPWISSTVLIAVMVFGGLLILVSLIGVIGVIKNHTGALTTYLVFIVFTCILFLTCAIVGYTSYHTAQTWQEVSYAGGKNEPDMSDLFNQLYCLSSAIYVCTRGSAVTGLKKLSPSLYAELVVEQVT